MESDVFLTVFMFLQNTRRSVSRRTFFFSAGVERREKLTNTPEERFPYDFMRFRWFTYVVAYVFKAQKVFDVH
jgi:hypothetical protein